MQLLSNTHINFIQNRKTGYIISGILILASIVSLILHNGPKYNIDFTGGTLVHFKFEKPIEIESVRAAISTKGYGDSEIKHFGSDQDISIRSGSERTVQELSTTLEKILKDEFPDNPFIVQQVEKVGPKIGTELIRDTLLAIFWAMVLILIYVMWRFEFKFSLGAIIALMHDITITIGIFSLLEIEVSSTVIAAILTIVGYSLNDTIVVFDRIRENLKVKQKNAEAFVETVNRSLNETLSRTIITSLTTLFVVSILFFFGGEVLRSFALALIIGILVGTYSSLFIATPTVVELQLRWHAKK
jgi:preprotein translocase SecF subunit